MSKHKNAYIAERTLEIIDTGILVRETDQIDVSAAIHSSVDRTFTLSPEELEKLAREPIVAPGTFETELLVTHQSTIEALLHESAYRKTTVLNFASAKNPGGGFIGGASAQEESLARSSSLYASLTKNLTMYQYNRAHSSFLYSDYLIYSPDVLFWMNDNGDFLDKPVPVHVITSPAPNKGAMLQHHRENELEALEDTFKRRIDHMLATAFSQQSECLILGAWGCGVFQNDPVKVAGYFKELLEGKYANCFKKIVFAIYGRKDVAILNIFKEAFEIPVNY